MAASTSFYFTAGVGSVPLPERDGVMTGAGNPVTIGLLTAVAIPLEHAAREKTMMRVTTGDGRTIEYLPLR